MPLRGVYKRISPECRNRVLKAAESNLDWQAVAAAHEIPYRTAYGWLRNGGQPLRPRGGDTRSKLSNAQIEVVLTWLEENPTLTLKDIRNRIEHEKGVEVFEQRVSNRLDGRL